MARTHCDVTDEVIIAAPPAAVWEALLAEHAGQTHWWAPFWEAHPREAGPLTVGSEIDFVVHPAGDRKRVKSHFTGRVTALVDERLASAEFVSGDLRGMGEWLLEPADAGTHLQMHFKARAHGPRPWLADALFGLGKNHSRVVRQGFKGLKRHLLSQPQESASGK